MSREIDARVAREVMGWKEDKTDGCGYPKGDFYPPNHMHGVERILGFETDHVETRKFEPSTDMNAAMEVVEAVVSRLGGTVEMTLEEDGWWVVFKIRPGCWHGWKNKSLPLAICLAALEAVKSTG